MSYVSSCEHRCPLTVSGVSAQELIFAMTLLITVRIVIINRGFPPTISGTQQNHRVQHGPAWRNVRKSIFSSCSLCPSHSACLLSGPATHREFKMKCHGLERTCRRKDCERLHPWLGDGGIWAGSRGRVGAVQAKLHGGIPGQGGRSFGQGLEVGKHFLFLLGRQK